MQPIKVFHIITVSSSLKGLMLNQLVALQKAGYELTGVASPGPELRDVEAAGIRCIALPIARDLAPLPDLRTLWQLYWLLRRERPTIVHTHLAKAALLGQIAARLAGVPIILNTIHGYHFHEQMSAPKRRFYMALEKFVTRFSDRVLSQNREDVQTALAAGIGSPAKMIHIGNGIELARFAPAQLEDAAVQAKRAELAIPADAPVVGFVGRLAARRKGFLDFLAAGARLAEQLPNVHFLIAGETDHGKPDAVEPAAAAAYGIADRCHFIGFQPNNEMPLIYAMMNVLLLPSPYEGIPRAIMEAAAMGVPVVATDVRGNREAVVDGDNGHLVPHGDVNALARAALAILTDRESAVRMSEAGRELARRTFDEQLVFAQIQTIYAELLQENQYAVVTPSTATTKAASGNSVGQ